VAKIRQPGDSDYNAAATVGEPLEALGAPQNQDDSEW
jgi:hypothetical protein